MNLQKQLKEEAFASGEVIDILTFVQRLTLANKGSQPIAINLTYEGVTERIEIGTPRFEAVMEKRMFVPYNGLGQARLLEPLNEDTHDTQVQGSGS